MFAGNIKACGPHNAAVRDGEHFVLEVTGGSLPADGACRVHYNPNVPLHMEHESYEVSADLYNENTGPGHLGLMYNVQDIDNFDAIYFRYVVHLRLQDMIYFHKA